MKNHCWSLVAGVVLAAGCSAPVQPKVVAPDPVADGLRQLRAATRPFQSLDSAVAAGYPRTVADCLIHEHHGAMGFHHVNRANLDAVVDVARPEILLYERLADGRYRLNGVEFIVPYRAWPRDSVAPTLMGRSMKREDNLKFWFTHVWAWTDNPDGVFADFHPAVACPADNRKIYRAPTE
jgi:hypothetical protein